MPTKVFTDIFSLLYTSYFLLQSVSGNPVNSRQSRHIVEDLHFKRTPQTAGNGGSFFSVLGVAGVAGTNVHPRLEIRQLEQNADQWNVYLLGLNRFQQMNETDMLSYYQIAGIHGKPFIAWDGVQQSNDGGGGYCTHDSNLFLTWHRPYLALFEEILYINCRQAVAEFPVGSLKDQYTSALATFRMPYWDWAMVPPAGQVAMPSSLQRPTVQVVMPNGTNTISNPLYAYRFHPLIYNDFYDDGEPQFSVWPTTVRDPSTKQVNAASRNDLVANQMDQSRANLQSRLYHIFTMETDYFNMSSDASLDDSLEAVHDTVHYTIGSGGHMSDIPYAAFDPIFWLHHTMIDRCFAIWQALYPNSYVEPMAQTYATFTTPAGSVEDMSSPLTPFHMNGNGEFWTSTLVRSTTTFSYTYPELQNGNDTAALMATINALYGSNASQQKRQHYVDDVYDKSEREERDGLSTAKPERLYSRAISGAPSYSSGREYIANIKAQKFGLDGSFSVFVFLGSSPTTSPANWSGDPSFVGLNGIFSTTAISESGSDIQANGAVPLTAALEAKLAGDELVSLNEEVVGPYLRSQLNWKVRSMDGNEIPVDQVPGFQVSVLWSKVQPASSHYEFPRKIGGYNVLTSATSGRPGGFQHGDQL
ncbi:Di-copper centre-containing protein [Glonium stellatum]|uniref:tyrosinase n=1 Tax=Glonium stellatum TaxID=574774 RepID=A0A8E2EM46_9PEZI|nr:Di-copper centre-containing protein [Glonium stellatum]